MLTSLTLLGQSDGQAQRPLNFQDHAEGPPFRLRNGSPLINLHPKHHLSDAPLSWAWVSILNFFSHTVHVLGQRPMPPDPDSPRPKFNISADGTPRRFRDTSGSHPCLPRSLWGLVEVPGSPEPLPCGRLPPQLFVCTYVYCNLLSLFMCSLAIEPNH